jgi:Ca2+-binding RTX toxin-like protein
MSTYVSYTPGSAISRAMFNFDVYSGWQNFKTYGTVRVSVSDSFSYRDYLSPTYSNFYSALYIDGTSSGEVRWDADMLASVQEVLSIYNQFANLNLQWVGDFDSGVDGSPNPEDVGLTRQSDINIAWIDRNDVGLAGISGANSDNLAFAYVGGAGDIFLNAWALVDTSLELNTSSRQILMHELGHSLGLSHPHTRYANGVPTISTDYAATRYLGFDKLGFRTSSADDMYKEYFSIMSYDDTESFLPGDDTVFYAHTPMILDVIALQQAYGLGAGTHGSGNDVIEAGTAGYRTYFDVGGTDTIDLSMYTSGAYLHMGTTITDAAYLVGVAMSSQDARSTISAAQSPANLRWFYGSYENALGGAADDWIIGNAFNNEIVGGAGADLLSGGDGSDTFRFNANANGIDTISDFELGDVLKIEGANFSTGVTLGSGLSVGRDQIQIAQDQAVTRVYIGTDAVAGADITVILSGLFKAEQFALTQDTIGLQVVAVAQTVTVAQPVVVAETVSPTESQPMFRSLGSGSTQYLVPQAYEGPLDIDYQLIDNTPNAVLIGSAFNDFLKLGGSGNKAVDGAAGADIIDGGTGSTFITGGGVGAAETFFLDGRAAGVSWSTITDFELGTDKATIWGWKAGVSRVSTAFADFNNGGASGYTGLTLHFENLLPDGSPSGSLNANLNSITFSNLSLSTFGASSVTELNQQITSGSNSHFVVGQTNDVYGEHGFLYIS